MKQPKLQDVRIDVEGTKVMRKMMAQVRATAKKAGLKKSDIEKAIQKVRSQRHSR